eukprot:scaffold103_cov193-Alexandrium_tamarense.AAC.22
METTGHFFFRRTPTSIDRIPSSNGDGVPRTKLQTNSNMADPNSLLKGMLGIGANTKDAKDCLEGVPSLWGVFLVIGGRSETFSTTSQRRVCSVGQRFNGANRNRPMELP